MKTAQWKMNSPVGPLYLTANEKGLTGVLWDRGSDPMAKDLEGSSPEIGFLAQTVRELTEYFDGRRTAENRR